MILDCLRSAGEVVASALGITLSPALPHLKDGLSVDEHQMNKFKASHITTTALLSC